MNFMSELASDPDVLLFQRVHVRTKVCELRAKKANCANILELSWITQETRLYLIMIINWHFIFYTNCNQALILWLGKNRQKQINTYKVKKKGIITYSVELNVRHQDHCLLELIENSIICEVVIIVYLVLADSVGYKQAHEACVSDVHVNY